jgi:EpsI family protein
MVAAALLSIVLTPTRLTAATAPKIDLETMIPKQFGDWTMLQELDYLQVSPELQSALDKIYAQVLTRTYVNRQGYQIMLTIPYGTEQTDALSAHDPAGCYPAQGFKILSDEKQILHTTFGDIPLRRMETEKYSLHELVTYWFTVGNYAANNDWDRKKVKLRYALNGEISDGILFRVSSIDNDTQHAYQIQDMFIKTLLKNLPEQSRTRIAGLTH